MKTQWSMLTKPLHLVLLSPVTEAQVSRLFSNLDVQKALSDIANRPIKIASEPLLFIVYCLVCHKLYKAKEKSYLSFHGEEAQEKQPGL